MEKTQQTFCLIHKQDPKITELLEASITFPVAKVYSVLSAASTPHCLKAIFHAMYKDDTGHCCFAAFEAGYIIGNRKDDSENQSKSDVISEGFKSSLSIST
jgi:hypothetical protein